MVQCLGPHLRREQVVCHPWRSRGQHGRWGRSVGHGLTGCDLRLERENVTLEEHAALVGRDAREDEEGEVAGAGGVWSDSIDFCTKGRYVPGEQLECSPRSPQTRIIVAVPVAITPLQNSNNTTRKQSAPHHQVETDVHARMRAAPVHAECYEFGDVLDHCGAELERRTTYQPGTGWNLKGD